MRTLDYSSAVLDVPNEPVENRELFRFTDPRQERIHKRLAIVRRGGKAIDSAFIFTVTDAALLDDSLHPYDWYKALVLAGAREHNVRNIYAKSRMLNPSKIPITSAIRISV